jgi:hypothetical protein
MCLLLLAVAQAVQMMGNNSALVAEAVAQVAWSMVAQHHFHQTHTQLLLVGVGLTGQTETTQQSMLVLG